MTVKELIEELKAFPPETPVALASDSEGNSFHRVELAETELYDGVFAVLWPTYEVDS